MADQIIASETKQTAHAPMPPSLQRYFVTSGRGGGWLVFREGRPRALRGAEQKVIATETAKVLARQDAPSEVWVEQRDGSFAVKYVFGPGGVAMHELHV